MTRPRARFAAAAAAALAASAAALGAANAAGGPLDSGGTAVGVSEREFRISPYRKTVPPGVVRFNVKNFGEDVHDLVVVSPKGRKLGTTGEIRSGEQSILRLKLKSQGTYRLVCTQADHGARGMKSRITVRKPRR
jgi:plastocyanin